MKAWLFKIAHIYKTHLRLITPEQFIHLSILMKPTSNHMKNNIAQTIKIFRVWYKTANIIVYILN